MATQITFQNIIQPFCNDIACESGVEMRERIVEQLPKKTFEKQLYSHFMEYM